MSLHWDYLFYHIVNMENDILSKYFVVYYDYKYVTFQHFVDEFKAVVGFE